MNVAFWAADSLATQINANANAARARGVLRRQQGFHCGDLAIQMAALAELHRLDPGNPLFSPGVRGRIYSLAEREFWRHGWARGSSLETDPHAVLHELLAEFETARAQAIKKARAEPVKPRRRGWFFINRRTVFCWRKAEHATEHAAAAAQQTELDRLQAARLGDPFDPSASDQPTQPKNPKPGRTT